jgi:toxin ParE1/3/4
VLPVVWRDEASAQPDEILTYIDQFDEATSDRLEALALACAERLADFPYAYRSGRIAGTREAVFHPNYLLIYRVGTAHVDILGVLHARQQYPPA